MLDSLKDYIAVDVDKLDGPYIAAGIPMKSFYHGDPFMEAGVAFDNGYEPLFQNSNIPEHDGSFLDLDGFSGSVYRGKESKLTH